MPPSGSSKEPGTSDRINIFSLFYVFIFYEISSNFVIMFKLRYLNNKVYDPNSYSMFLCFVISRAIDSIISMRLK